MYSWRFPVWRTGAYKSAFTRTLSRASIPRPERSYCSLGGFLDFDIELIRSAGRPKIHLIDPYWSLTMVMFNSSVVKVSMLHAL